MQSHQPAHYHSHHGPRDKRATPLVDAPWVEQPSARRPRTQSSCIVDHPAKNQRTLLAGFFFHFNPPPSSPVVRAETLRFKEEGVFGVVKDVFLPWYNAYRCDDVTVTYGGMGEGGAAVARRGAVSVKGRAASRGPVDRRDCHQGCRAVAPLPAPSTTPSGQPSVTTPSSVPSTKTKFRLFRSFTLVGALPNQSTSNQIQKTSTSNSAQVFGSEHHPQRAGDRGGL